MSTEYDLKDIVRKVSALRAKAERAGTPEEAAAFAEKVVELMTKYNIEEVQLDTFRPDDLRGFVNDEGILTGGRWRPLLVVAIAKSFFIELVVSGSARNKQGHKFYHMIGRAENVEVAKQTFAWLVDEINRMSGIAYKEAWTTKGETQWRNEFRNGASEVVSRRLYMQHRAQQTAAATSTALVVIEDQSKLALAKFYPHLETCRTNIGGAYCLHAPADHADGRGKCSRCKCKSYNDGAKSIGGKQRSGDAYSTGRAVGERISLTPTQRLS